MHMILQGKNKMTITSKWISIKDRLPEISKQVLTYETGNPAMPIKVNYIHNYENEFAYGRNKNITHWMPLPEPPK